MLVAALLSLPGSASADLWSGFYRSTTPAPPVSNVPPKAIELSDDAVCIAAILEAQSRYGIPDNILLSIGIQEAGRNVKRGLSIWPWSANAEGTGAFFPNRDALLKWVRHQNDQGVRSIDVGCMQINQKWHGSAFQSLEQAVDPQANVDYAARYLSDLYRSEGSWWKAAGRYHSATEKYKTIYLKKLARNQQIATRNLDAFLELVVTQEQSPPASVAKPTPLPAQKAIWGNLNDKSQTHAFTIYSQHPMQPIVPDFKEMF